MQSSQPSLLMRDDTFLGVCEALGEDLGFHPNYLRVAFAVALLWNPVAAIGAYAVAGAIVAFSRLVVRDKRPAAVHPEVEAGETVGVQSAANSDSEMAVAA